MKAIIKESFSKAELSSGDLLVTPKSFNSVKEWQGVEVSGTKYYVDKAVKLGGKKPKPKKKTD
jgi:hypothetical protein